MCEVGAAIGGRLVSLWAKAKGAEIVRTRAAAHNGGRKGKFDFVFFRRLFVARADQRKNAERRLARPALYFPMQCLAEAAAPGGIRAHLFCLRAQVIRQRGNAAAMLLQEAREV